MTDFLLELRSEEIPARMQAGARENLARLFAAELAAAGLTATETITYATPRRLALIARGLPAETQPVREEVKGPKTTAPAQALDGFLRKTGLAREQLEERDGTFFAVTERPGRATADVLAAAIPAIIRAFPWPKSMRWGAASASTESLRWVRPLHGVVALFGEDIVPVTIAGIESSATTLGHRFHHPGAITIGSAADYVEKLRACHVIVDPAERATLIRDRARQLAADAGLALIADEGLVAENAGLTEWPVPLLGRFDAAFLDVPPEVIQLTARVNQKYFVCSGPPRASLGEGDRAEGVVEGRLANAFICVANIAATDGGARIVEGNRKVLAARLADARFFYETDLKTPLEEQAKKLDRIVFHEKLGTVADKVDRVAKLARWLVEEGIVGTPLSSPSSLGEGDHAQHGGGASRDAETSAGPSTIASGDGPPPRDKLGEDRAALATLAERAARLAKADLVTGMVGEFPELQGVMGGYYAAAQGEDPQIAAAIRDHYKPVGQGDEVPTAPVTVAVSLADKLDTLIGFFGVNLPPTGSKDPFALRRAAIGAIQTLTERSIRVNLLALYSMALSDHVQRFIYAEMKRAADADASALVRAGTSPHLVTSPEYQAQFLARSEVQGFVSGFAAGGQALLDFFADRLKVQQREAGVRHDLIDAVFALGGEDDLVRLLARVRALQAFVGTDDGANLLAGYKRAANILKKEGYSPSPRERGASGRSGPRPDLNRPGDGSPDAGRAEGAQPQATPPVTAPLPDLLPREEREQQKTVSYTPELAETALTTALDAAEPAAAQAIAREDFGGAMAALATLRAPIDAFFDGVTVNDPDPAKRDARLALLDRVRAAVHTVADFSRIEG